MWVLAPLVRLWARLFARFDPLDVVPDVREGNKREEEDIRQGFRFISNDLIEHPQSANRLKK